MWKIYTILMLFCFNVINAERKAIANLSITTTNDLRGTVNFLETSDGVIQITGVIFGLSEGDHGFHIHEKNNFTEGCNSTGTHFNPLNHSHGAPNDIERHVGDLGNIVANASGIAEIRMFDTIIKLNGDLSIINRTIVIHADTDDLGKGGFEDSHTTGHAGARLACGVITLTESGSGTMNRVHFYFIFSFTIIISLIHII